MVKWVSLNPLYKLGDNCKSEKASSYCFEETLLLEQSLETASTDFISRVLALYALRVILGLCGGLEKEKLEGGLVKIEVGCWKL